MPGGGVGIFNGCTAEWGAPSSGWGAQYGGIEDRSACDSFPKALQAGCYWRFDWFKGASNPDVSFEQVACPAALTKNTGCIRADDSSEKAAAGGSGAASSLASSPAAAQPATSSSATASSFLSQTTSSTSSAYVAPVAASSLSTPSASPGIFPQIPSAGESSTTTVMTTTTAESSSSSSHSAHLQVVTVTIDACGM